VTTFDASLDYWSDRDVVPSVKSRAQEYVAFDTHEEGRKSRSGFLSFLLLNILLWPILVFVGLQVSASHSPGALKSLMTSAGVQSMTANQLVATVKHQGRTVFWLNAKQGDSYSNSSSTPGVDHISYRPAGSNISNLNQFDVMIGTYRDFSTYLAQPHPFLGVLGRTVTLSTGGTLTYNQKSPNRAIVAFAAKPEIVVLDYPSTQGLSTLINDAQNLVPIN
jgi:nitrate reductase NapE component